MGVAVSALSNDQNFVVKSTGLFYDVVDQEMGQITICHCNKEEDANRICELLNKDWEIEKLSEED